MFRFVCLMCLFFTPCAFAAQPFGLWLQEFKKEAQSKGIDALLLEQTLGGITANERVIELDRKQPESTKTFTQYLQGAVSEVRVSKGRKMYRQHRALLEEIGAKYGVQPRFIVALWGIETNYGGYTGNLSVVRSLATLAHDGRRSAFFRDELLKALQIIQQGHISAGEMDGSWAGAMGQCQFMPSSFLAYAVDYDGDGRKDIWNTLPDVFASIANYLKQSGWNDELTWGRAVQVPASMGDEMLDGKQYKALSRWQKLGVRSANGGGLPQAQIEGALTLPGKRHEQAYLIYRNYDVLLKWNRSRYFATAVGLLSDAIARP